MDWQQLWDQGKSDLEKAFSDVVATGTPAIKASLEQWGADVLQEQANASKKELAAQVDDISKHPSAPGTFGAAFSDVMKSTVVDKYGVWILLGVGGLVILGVMLGKK